MRNMRKWEKKKKLLIDSGCPKVSGVQSSWVFASFLPFVEGRWIEWGVCFKGDVTGWLKCWN